MKYSQVLNRGKAVIESCETIYQLTIARKYCILLLRNYVDSSQGTSLRLADKLNISDYFRSIIDTKFYELEPGEEK